jgi:hypothetical protein
MFGQVGRFCSDLAQKLRLLASSPELPPGASVVMVGKLEQRYSILLSAIVSNPILYFTYINPSTYTCRQTDDGFRACARGQAAQA